MYSVMTHVKSRMLESRLHLMMDYSNIKHRGRAWNWGRKEALCYKVVKQKIRIKKGKKYSHKEIYKSNWF